MFIHWCTNTILEPPSKKQNKQTHLPMQPTIASHIFITQFTPCILCTTQYPHTLWCTPWIYKKHLNWDSSIVFIFPFNTKKLWKWRRRRRRIEIKTIWLAVIYTIYYMLTISCKMISIFVHIDCSLQELDISTFCIFRKMSC